jgi:4-amino-4-deoxychorismate lyase
VLAINRQNSQMPQHVLAILNRPSMAAAPHLEGAPPFAFVDPDARHVSALDLGATRGDGIFETLSVGSGHPQAIDHHLRRFARSAELLDLPAPALDTWRSVIDAVVAELKPGEEAWVKAVMTRGVEGDGRPSGWVYGSLGADHSAVRTDGISVVTLDRGFKHDVEQTSPWLLAGAKTLSYAINRSVLREAARRGADDVIFVSSDGFVLEGPTSSVVFRRGNQLFTPGTGLGILDGTTQANVFRYAESLGMTTGFEMLSPEKLRQADAAWLVSSVRLAVPIRKLDGTVLAVDADLTAGINRYLKQLRD